MTSYNFALDPREEERDYELGAAMGDPRRCPRHPGVATSSPDGMFDGHCHLCEGEMDDADAAWDRDPENPHRRYCGNEAPYINNARNGVGDACIPDECPF